jgi:hypothetical protein
MKQLGHHSLDDVATHKLEYVPRARARARVMRAIWDSSRARARVMGS